MVWSGGGSTRNFFARAAFWCLIWGWKCFKKNGGGLDKKGVEKGGRVVNLKNWPNRIFWVENLRILEFGNFVSFLTNWCIRFPFFAWNYNSWLNYFTKNLWLSLLVVSLIIIFLDLIDWALYKNNPSNYKRW